MVAPVRTPQARGVKCDLCKKILSLTTWLDQTKLAKSVLEATNVLNLIASHDKSGCSCIPKNIQNLILGSTHFEIHRLIFASLDAQTHKKQVDLSTQARQKAASETNVKSHPLNDCNDTQKVSRFKVYSNYNDQDLIKKSKEHLIHLTEAICYWKSAVEDQSSPFNSKLALRLGLTHHVIYACYLFKFYKILDQHLITANLLLNLFLLIEGITSYAILHANFLYIRALLELNQTHLARQYLKQAIKIPEFQDKTHYESILLTCLLCEFSLIDSDSIHESIDELARLAVIQPNDKLQHYYARSLAMSIVIKYIHYYPARSECCFEFYHNYRFLGAIIRRCYESSFVTVLNERSSRQPSQQKESETLEQVSGHSWVRFAVCDFVFTSFEHLARFFMRTGQPESLELLYNGLNLISYRTGCCYWQFKMLEIGSYLDLLCDRYSEASAKLDVASYITNYIDNSYLMNLMRVSSEVCLLSSLNQQGTLNHLNVVLELLDRIKLNLNSSIDKMHPIELFDCKTLIHQKTIKNTDCNEFLVPFVGSDHGYLGLRVIRIAISLMMRLNLIKKVQCTFSSLGNQLANCHHGLMSFDHQHLLLESLLLYCKSERSEHLLVEAVSSSSTFLKVSNSLESQLSNLTLDTKPSSRKTSTRRSKSKITLPRTKRKGLYDVASNSRENLPASGMNEKELTIAESLMKIDSIGYETLVLLYLRHSEPNPDYLLYRCAHELLFALRLSDVDITHDQLLYHFVESNTSNTMRYRWMLFDEPHADIYDQTSKSKALKTTSQTRWLGFNNSTTDVDLSLKTMRRSIPEDTRLIQVKYILEETQREEYLLIASFDSGSKPIFALTKRSLEFGGDTLDQFCNGTYSPSSFPEMVLTKVEASKKTLFLTNQRTRSEKRQNLESDLGVLLYDLESELIGPFRFLFCPRTLDTDYSQLVRDVKDIIESKLFTYKCKSEQALQLMLSNSPLLNRDEFCTVLTILFNCENQAGLVRECFDIWMKSMESFLSKQGSNVNKLMYLQRLARGQLGLILDKKLEHIPFESLPVARILKSGIFRVPSLRLYHSIVVANHNQAVARVDMNSAFYLLDPADNLGRTRERFETKLKAQLEWQGWVAKAPESESLEELLRDKNFYLFIGHGAGALYYNQLRNGRGLNAMPSVRSTALIMGCSSGRVASEGPRLESFGISWVFIMRGSPAYVGLLWDVTDTDIDKFLDALLKDLLGDRWIAPPGSSHHDYSSLTEAMSRARQACQLKLLVGSTPVLHGLPVLCR